MKRAVLFIALTIAIVGGWLTIHQTKLLNHPDSVSILGPVGIFGITLSLVLILGLLAFFLPSKAKNN